MADLDENLIDVLEADGGVSAITTTIAINNMPEQRSLPYIWIQSDDEFDETDLSGTGGASIETFDVECCSNNLTQAKDLQAAVKTLLHGKTGSFGDQNIAFAEVTSKDDTYESRQDFGDLGGVHVAALTLEIGVDGR